MLYKNRRLIIMIRKGYYCKYKGKIYRCATRDTTVLLRSPDVEDFQKNGFEKNPYFGQNKFYDVGKYIKVVPNEEIEWFCNIWNVGKYKGYDVEITNETDTEYTITPGYISINNGVFTKENGFEEIDRYLFEGKVPKSEVTDVKEEKGPINKELKAPDDWNF